MAGGLAASKPIRPRKLAVAETPTSAPRAGCELADQAAAEADGYGVRARARLELREQVADVGLHGLFREEETLADLPVDEPLGDQLENLGLADRRVQLELAEGALERDHLGGAGIVATPSRDGFEPAGMIPIPGHDLVALSSVHARSIGRAPPCL